MPTYEYACTACGQHVEVFQRLSESPLTTCGVCGGPLRKVFHPAGIVFKGSGFYATDSRSGSKSGIGGAERSAGSTGATDGKGSSDPKPAGTKDGSPKTAAGTGGKSS